MRALATALLVMATVTGAQQPVRDQPAQRATVGKGAVAGRVMNGETGRPIADALVALIGGDTTTIRVAQSDAEGAFILPGVPAGKFVLGASKLPYLGSLHGATRPGRPGTPVVLTDGQIVAGLEIRMWPGAVVTGAVTDEQGEPVAGAEVQLQKSAATAGGGQMAQMLAAIGNTSRSVTDDRGVYRVYGIAPGEYLVTASVPTALAQARRLAQREIADAMRALRETPPGPGSGRAAPPPAAAPPAPGRGPEVPNSMAVGSFGIASAYAPVYFPGTTDLSRAATVTIAVGEERTGVNIRMEVVPLARVEGAVLAVDGSPATQVQVTLVRLDDTSILSLLQSRASSRTAATGQFTLRNVAPGQYRVLARTLRAGPAASGPVFWANADITIGGQDVTGLVMQLQPGLSLTGRIRVEATRLTESPELTTITVVAVPMSNTRDQIGVLAGLVGGSGGQSARADGTFEVSGLIPGPHLLHAVLPNPRTAFSWRPTSVLVDGRELLDLPFDLKPGAPPQDVVIKLSDVQQKLSGVIADSSGQPLTASTVLLFATERQYWYPDSRRVLVARPGTDGSYEFSGLLGPSAGEHFLSVVSDLDPSQQYDPAFLDALAKAAPIRLTLGPGESKRQDLKVR